MSGRDGLASDAERLRHLAAILSSAEREFAFLDPAAAPSQPELIEALSVAEAAVHRALIEIREAIRRKGLRDLG